MITTPFCMWSYVSLPTKGHKIPKMSAYSFTWFRPIMFSCQFYARFAGGVMQGFQLLDRFDHNSSEESRLLYPVHAHYFHVALLCRL